jgi:hypothetical protein
MMRRIGRGRLFLVVLEALVTTWALSYLGEYVGWSWVREAGGLVLRVGL